MGVISRRADRFVRNRIGRRSSAVEPKPREKKRRARVASLFTDLNVRRRKLQRLRRGL